MNKSGEWESLFIHRDELDEVLSDAADSLELASRTYRRCCFFPAKCHEKSTLAGEVAVYTSSTRFKWDFDDLMKSYACVLCRYDTNDRSNFKWHLRTKVHRAMVTTGSPPPKRQQIWPCSLCRSVFKRSDHWKKHCSSKKHQRNALAARRQRRQRFALDGDWI